MEHDIQDLFNQIKEKKEELKGLKATCKEMLEASEEYQETMQKMKALRAKKQRVITAVNEQCSSEISKMMDLSIDIAGDQEMLTDIAITKYTKGESIELKDQYDNIYEPIFSVKFKKAN